MRISTVIALIVSLGVGTFLVYTGYLLHRDVESVAHRAQVAADVPDMLLYMKTLKAGLAEHGMTTGHTALMFKTPSNDLTLLNNSIDQIIVRLDALKDVPRTETTYQVALDDIRGTIRELESPSMGFLFVQYWFLFVIGAGIWLWPLIAFIRDDYY